MLRDKLLPADGPPSRPGWPDLVLGALVVLGLVSGLEWLQLGERLRPPGVPTEVHGVVTDVDSTEYSRKRTYMTPIQSFRLKLRTNGGETLTFAFPRYRWSARWPRAMRPGDTLRVRYRRVGDEVDYPAVAVDEVHRGDEAILPLDHADGLRMVLNRHRRKSLWLQVCLGALAVLWLKSRWFPTARELATRG